MIQGTKQFMNVIQKKYLSFLHKYLSLYGIELVDLGYRNSSVLG
ncbi:MAG: hypothetical protein RLZZ628_2745 [Bacteroidota bacterium]|jgi:hypothetical protein